jgi:hypothetical protein
MMDNLRLVPSLRLGDIVLGEMAPSMVGDIAVCRDLESEEWECCDYEGMNEKAEAIRSKRSSRLY